MDDKSSGIRTAEDSLAKKLILNTYKTLLTRGKRLFYLCEDSRSYFKKLIKQ